MMTDLREEHLQMFESFKKKASPEMLKIMDRAIEDIESSSAKGLNVGQHAPDFALPDATGQKIHLSEELKKGPVIVSFYRGGWCPYCNLELRAYQTIIDDINKAGGQLIAISPESPDQSLSTKEKNELTFHLLTDKGNHTAEKYNLVYRMPDYLIELYKKLNLNLESHNEDNSWTLPISATFVISQDSIIEYEYTKADYKQRAEPSEVLNKLKELSKQESNI
jgi:peroxiredoxin